MPGSNEKQFDCYDCGRRFKTKPSLLQHKRDAHGTRTARRAKADMAAALDAFDDLPDGAYFAAMDDLGVSLDDLKQE